MLGFYLRIRRVPSPLTHWKGDHTIVPEMRRNHHELKLILRLFPQPELNY